jgi:hypothetical protein
MLRKWNDRCHINRPGCGRKAVFAATVLNSNEEEQELHLCEHCAELLLSEDKIIEIKDLE